MKIEILKSAKGNDQKQNKPAKPPKLRIPKTQVGPHAKKTKNEGKESYKSTLYNVCSVHRGVFSTLGGIMSTLGDIMSTLGDIMSTLGDVQYIGGIS